MKSASIQFRYAFDENGRTVDIFTLTDEDRKDYKCAGCESCVIPILGKIKKKHFRHKTAKFCSFETYLHKMGKALFCEAYQNCMATNSPFYLEFKRTSLCNSCKHGPCNVEQVFEKYDLTKLFRNLEVEKRDGEFIPDILLYNAKGDKIYIEIANTHLITDKKIDSGVKIIEINLSKEEDLEVFKKAVISIKSPLVFFYNFDPKPLEKNSKASCPKTVLYFVVYPSGKANIKRAKIFDFDKIEARKDLYISKIPLKSAYYFIKEVESAFLNGAPIKNCFLCRYHARVKRKDLSEQEKPIFCKFLKFYTGSNHAAECKYFIPDKKVLEKEVSKENPSEEPSDDALTFFKDYHFPILSTSTDEFAEKTAVCEVCGKVTSDWWYFDGKDKCKCRDCYPKKPNTRKEDD